MFNLGKLQEVYNCLQNKELWILLQWQSGSVMNFTIFFIVNIVKVQLLPNLMTPWHHSLRITHTYDCGTVSKPPSWSMQCACLQVRVSGMDDASPIWRCVWYINCSMLEVIKKKTFLSKFYWISILLQAIIDDLHPNVEMLYLPSDTMCALYAMTSELQLFSRLITWGTHLSRQLQLKERISEYSRRSTMLLMQ